MIVKSCYLTRQRRRHNFKKLSVTLEAGGHVSAFFNCDHGTLQGSVLGPVLFSLFIRPLYDMEELLTYADDSYFGESDVDVKKGKYLSCGEF